jgi:hypothetical protein
MFPRIMYFKNGKYYLEISFMYSFLRIMNVSSFYFLVSFLNFNSGFIKFILEIYISFHELCISNTDYKAAVPGSNPANASISS